MKFKEIFRAKAGLEWDKRLGEAKAGRYKFAEVNYERSSSSGSGKARSQAVPNSIEPTCTLSKPVQNLMKLIFSHEHLQAAVSSLVLYDSKKLPLGQLSQDTIKDGFKYLKQIAAILNNPGPGSTKVLIDLTNTYYSTIPHDFKRHQPPPIASLDSLRKEVQLIESLSDLKITDDLMKDLKTVENLHPLNCQYDSLQLKKLRALDPLDKEYQMLEDYLLLSTSPLHDLNYEVISIFDVRRPNEKAKLDDSTPKKLGSLRCLLWHGSRTSNFPGILRQGLRIAPPEAPATGYMFGKGIYLADVSSKSAGYCHPNVSHGHGLLLLCEAELGGAMKKYRRHEYDAREIAFREKQRSSMGEGEFRPRGWIDAGVINQSLRGVWMVCNNRHPFFTTIEYILTF